MGVKRIMKLGLIVLFSFGISAYCEDDGNGTIPYQSGARSNYSRPTAERSNWSYVSTKFDPSKAEMELRRTFKKFESGSFQQRLEAAKKLFVFAESGLERKVRNHLRSYLSDKATKTQAIQLLQELNARFPIPSGRSQTSCIMPGTYKKRIDVNGNKITFSELRYKLPDCKGPPTIVSGGTFVFKLEGIPDLVYEHQITYYQKGKKIRSDRVLRTFHGISFASPQEPNLYIPQ